MAQGKGGKEGEGEGGKKGKGERRGEREEGKGEGEGGGGGEGGEGSSATRASCTGWKMLAVTPKCNPTLYINHHENKSARITELRDFVKKRIKMNHGGGGVTGA